MFRPAPKSRLLNLMGFFSSFSGLDIDAIADIFQIWMYESPDQGNRVLLCKYSFPSSSGDLTIAAMVCLEAGTDKLDRGGWVGFGVPREYSNYEGRFRHKHAFQKLFVKDQIEDVCSP
jgi:hypothetical protein